MNTVYFESKAITPSKIICIGRNYVAHAKELGNAVPDKPVIFIKPNSAISTSLRSGIDETLHYEGELCFLVINKQLAGVAFGLDLTKRETQAKLKDKGLPWERAKAFDGSAVFSQFVTLDNIDLAQLSLSLLIDGELRQQGGVDLMLFKPLDILEEVSHFLSLEDGDIIMTGTPAGVGPVIAGTHFEGKVNNNGNCLINARWDAN
ncbi:MAG: fumarylacetoacetate hydrolase family protein [Cellvibrionaceae bacterium]